MSWWFFMPGPRSKTVCSPFLFPSVPTFFYSLPLFSPHCLTYWPCIFENSLLKTVEVAITLSSLLFFSSSLQEIHNMEDILNLEHQAVTSDMSPFHREGWNWNWHCSGVTNGHSWVTSLNYSLAQSCSLSVCFLHTLSYLKTISVIWLHLSSHLTFLTKTW